MKRIIFSLSFLIILFVLCSCNNKTEQLQAKLDSLEQNAYKPGFGEFMTYVQIHHDKLWFAGLNQNWPLADFELNEIKEAIAGIQKYEKDRKESQLVIMASIPLDSVGMAIQQKNPDMFKSTFTSLTNTCNNCHKQVNFGFNVVKIPDTPPFSNQDFKPASAK